MSPTLPKTRKINARKPSASRAVSLNIFLLLITIIVGIVGWIIGTIIYSSGVNKIAMPLLIGIIFAVLFFLLVITILVYSISSGSFEKNILTSSNNLVSSIFAIAIIGVLLFGLSIFFQWIYGMNFVKHVKQPTSYIFVIDDSGSMAENDPQQLRYNAISSVLTNVNPDFPYMIYGFSNDVGIISDMAPVSNGIPKITGDSTGGTSIRAALNRVIQDKVSGAWDGGTSPKVILLTDGYATDIGLFRSIHGVLKTYVKNGVSISTVGLGGVDKNLMSKIAKTTGGVYIDVSDASGLAEAMASAATQYTSRDLLSTRYTTNLNLLYAILRIIFISILGATIGFATAVAYGNQESSTLIIGSSAIKSVIGAILMEVCTDVMGFSDKMIWLVLWILISLTLATKPTTYKRGPRRPSRNRSSRRLT